MSSISCLLVDEDDSCMPSALNLYFGERLFDSNDDFYRKQAALLRGLAMRSFKPFDRSLLQCVRFKSRSYKAVYDFTLRHSTLGVWPLNLQNGNTKAILSYRCETNPDGHTEAINFCNGKITFLKNPSITILPFTSKTIQQYLDFAVHDYNYFLSIHHYQRFRN
jgi:hypothetical protein